MSTHCPISRRQGSTRVSGIACVGGLLIALQLWLALSSTALASYQATQVLPDKLSIDVARAGVSVVRLLAIYKDPAGPQEVHCTGLGTIVASWQPENVSEKNLWILTDGYLLGRGTDAAAPCAEEHPQTRLERVEVWTSDFYATEPLWFEAKADALSVMCLTECPEEGGVEDAMAALSGVPVLLSLSNTEHRNMGSGNPDTIQNNDLVAEPFIELVETNTRVGDALVLRRALSESIIPVPERASVDQEELLEFLDTVMQHRTPVRDTMTNPNLEPGTPIINEEGRLIGLHLQNEVAAASTPVYPVTRNDIQSALQEDVTDLDDKLATNTVHSSWEEGVSFYHQAGTDDRQSTALLEDARVSFQEAAEANPRFEAPVDYIALIDEEIEQSAPSNEDDGSGIANIPEQQEGNLFSMENLWWIGLIGLAVLVVLLVLVTVLFKRSRTQAQRRQELSMELAEAERNASVEAQRIQAMEAQQAMARQYSAPVPAVQPGMVAQQGSALAEQPTQKLRCPQCGVPIAYDANYCPQCRTWLSPSESGLNMRVLPQQPAAAPVPVSPLAEMPTMPQPPSVAAMATPIADQPTIPASSLKNSTPLSEQPTVAISPQAIDVEKTIPYPKSRRTRKSSPLGLLVGTRSDPGIKRKYKPNEDSLFAAQGSLGSSAPRPFGLFVVADGMGGHANGQEASRLAIQRIIEYVLPRLMKAESASDDLYSHLLSEGIQDANYAVHSRNVERARNAELENSDMGTTVTAALLVNATAYVANVGDSRTYLYSESDAKLSKVTNDHSVVASLVEAGIIKPDDIYTHPKRSHIYRSLGEKAAIEVDSFTVIMHNGDRLLLCSDGLWDMVRDPKIEGVVREAATDPRMTSDALIQAALDGGGEDNVSVVVVKVTSEVRPSKAAGLQLLAKPDTVNLPQL